MAAFILLLGAISARAQEGSALPPRDCLLLLREGRIYLELGKVERAFGLFSRALEEHPDQILPVQEILLNRESFELSPERIAELRGRLAARLRDPAHALDPGSIHFLISNAREEDSELLESVLAGIAARGEPLVSDPVVLRASVVAQVQLGRLSEGRRTLERLLEVDPSIGVVFRALELDRRLGRWDDALALLERYVNDPALDVALRPFYIQLLARSGRKEETLRELARLRSPEAQGLLASERYASTAKSVAWGLYDSGEREEVERLWREILAENPEDTEARQVVAHLFADGEERAALVEQVDADLAEETNPDRLLELGTEFLAAGDDERAYDLLSLIPKGARGEAAAFNLGLAALHLERWEEAIAAFRVAIRYNPSRPESHNHLANALREVGRCAEALPSLERTLELDPDRVAPWYWISKCREALGDAGAAAEAMAEYNRRNPDS